MEILLALPFLFQNHAGDGSPGSGGFVPRLSSPQAWMGRTGYRLSIENSLGGASGIIGISAAPGSSSWNGAPVWLDLGQLRVTRNFTLSGPAGVPGEGWVDLPFALPAPLEFLAGLTFWGQAAIFDPGASPSGICTSNALALVLTLPPKILVGCSVGSPSPWYTLDGLTGGLEQSGSFNGTAHRGVTRPGGLDQFLSVYGQGIMHGDWSGGSINWSPFWSTPSSMISGIAFDSTRQRLWVLAENNIGQDELFAVDADASSPTWGQTVAETTGASAVGIVQPWALSPDGNTAAIVKVLSDSVYLWDLDPSSSTYLQNTAHLDVPAHNQSAIHLVTNVGFTPDGKELVALVQHAGITNGEIGRYDLEAGVWIDHDPVAFGAQCIGELSSPPILMGSAPTDLDLARDGWMVVCGFGAPLGGGQGTEGWLGRLDTTSLSGSGVTWTPYTGGRVDNSWHCKLDGDQAVVAVGTHGAPAGDIQFLDASTMTFRGSEFLPGVGQITTLAWR